jgi:hypothetical protein
MADSFQWSQTKKTSHQDTMAKKCPDGEKARFGFYPKTGLLGALVSWWQ